MKVALQHTYFELTAKEKVQFRLKLVVMCLLILISVTCIAFYFKLFILIPFVFWVLLSNVASFIDVPAMVKSGKLTYQSLFLLSEKEKDSQVVIHGGTLFDYYFCIDKHDTPKARKMFVLSQYLSGILNVIEAYKDSPDLKIKGTTYILNERTANKIGFQIEQTDTIQKLILILNYPSLIVTNSIVNKTVSFPKLNSTKTCITDIGTLKKNRDTIREMRQRLVYTANGN